MAVYEQLELGFFFQAEDGIRDLVRSRGLGDVYKRQEGRRGDEQMAEQAGDGLIAGGVAIGHAEQQGHLTVSYTHLTLPTSDLV